MDFGETIAEAAAFDGGEVYLAVAACVEARVNGGFAAGGFGVELHGVCLNAHDGACMRSEGNVGNLREHGIGEVLDHEGHTMGAGPAHAKDGAGLSFAGFESDAGPAEFAAEFHEFPIVGAFVHEEGFARGD